MNTNEQEKSVDQFDNIASHTQKGIDFLEKYGHFVEQRCKIEQEYATKLRRLVKTFLPKKKEEEEYQFTSLKAYKNLLNELGDQAGQHELIAENLSTSVVFELSSLVKQLKDDRRKHLLEGARIQTLLQNSLSQLTKTKEKYEKAFGASERASEAYQKADDDINLSRAEVEKQRINSTIKSQQCDDCKNEYANQLQKTNELQNKYYSVLLPEVFQNLQDLDEKRVKCIQNFILKSVSVERDVIPIISRCLDGMDKTATDIDSSKDSRLVIEKFKSGFSPPGDFPFEDLSNNDNQSANGSMSSLPPQINQPIVTEKKTILGTITGGRVRRRTGILGLFSTAKGSPGNLNDKDDFSDLPPNQRRKKLQAKIEEITGKICQETAARDGLMKMKQVYEANTALGDPMSIQGQLTDNGQRLDKLRSEQKKYQDFLDEMEGRISNSPATSIIAQRPKSVTNLPQSGNVKNNIVRRNSVSDNGESLSRSGSDSSVSNSALNHNKNLNSSLHGSEPVRKVTCRILSPISKKTDDIKPSSSNSPESGIGMSSTSLPSSDQDQSDKAACSDVIDGDDDDEYFEAEPLPILGKCKALYPFEVTSEGSIRMEEGEDLWVIETDQGDGWTRVRRIQISSIDPMPEGFVPSSYIEITEMFSVPHLV